MNGLYPLRFTPVFKERIWGGDKIHSAIGYSSAPRDKCGEAWLISGVEGDTTIVSNGYLAGNEVNELVEVFMGDLVGDTVYEEYGDEFPILLKLIDAREWLSIQVHPDDALASKRYGTHGKSEMWYVLESEPGSQLITGFKRTIDREEYLRLLSKGSLEEVLNRETAAIGDVFDLPAGRIHALGPGVLLVEVQQTSDVTYRIHDWNRVDANGSARELHADMAVDAIDFEIPSSYRTQYRNELNRSNSVVENKHFTVNMIRTTQTMMKDYEELDSFVIFLCVEGLMNVKVMGWDESLVRGQALLVPKVFDNVILEPNGLSACLEIYIK